MSKKLWNNKSLMYDERSRSNSKSSRDDSIEPFGSPTKVKKNASIVREPKAIINLKKSLH